MMSDRVINSIEQIPVELWREIFEYFDLFGLWHSFRGLNRRIDAIIDQTPLHLVIGGRESYPKFMEAIHPTMTAANVANIRSLAMDATSEINDFLTLYPLNSLVQLRSLYLGNRFFLTDPTFQSWKQLASFKHLRSLVLSFAKLAYLDFRFKDKDFFTRTIFEKAYCTPLKNIPISTRDSEKPKPTIPSFHSTTTATNLRSVSIDSLSFHDLMELLPALGNVKSLCITYELYLDEESIESPFKADTLLLPKCLLLELRLDDKLTFEHVEYLLKQTPNLKSLLVLCWLHLTDAKKWEVLLSTYCPKLIKLELMFTSSFCHKTFDGSVHCFEDECQVAPFWVQRKVTTSAFEDRARDFRPDLIVKFDLRQSES